MAVNNYSKVNFASKDLTALQRAYLSNQVVAFDSRMYYIEFLENTNWIVLGTILEGLVFRKIEIALTNPNKEVVKTFTFENRKIKQIYYNFDKDIVSPRVFVHFEEDENEQVLL